MPDVNRGDRPLSPFMLGSYYRLQITSVLSILHRITGAGLTVGMFLVVWWLVAGAVAPQYFDTVDGILSSWFGVVILGASLWALWFHLLNGVRHLVWDTGRGFDLDSVTTSGWAVVAGSVVLTVITFFFF